jgi:hypothetical protein
LDSCKHHCPLNDEERWLWASLPWICAVNWKEICGVKLAVPEMWLTWRSLSTIRVEIPGVGFLVHLQIPALGVNCLPGREIFQPWLFYISNNIQTGAISIWKRNC